MLLCEKDDNYYFPIVVVGNKMDLLDEENHPSPSSSPPLDNENIDEDSHNNNNNDKNETWKTSPATATDLEQATVTAFMAREEVKKWCREVIQSRYVVDCPLIFDFTE